MDISIVMPAYNEEDVIEETVRRCFAVLLQQGLDGEVIVCNDGSRDNTATILDHLKTEFASLVVVSHSPNQGYGASLADAIHASTGKIVVSIDSDGQFDITELPQLVAQFTDEVDVLTGYRRRKQDSFLKVFADRMMNLMIRCMFGTPLKDTNCAFKLYRGNVIRAMFLEARGFQIPTEIVLKLPVCGYVVREAPITHSPRMGGRSSLAPFKTAMSMMTFLIYLRIKIALFRQNVIRSL